MRLDRDSFIHALECWQLDVDMDEDSYVVTCGAAKFTLPIDSDQLNSTLVNNIAMNLLGRCYECGNAPIHPNVKSFGGHKCRDCELKGGDKSAFAHEFDLDKVRQLVGPAVLRKMIDTCSWDRW